MKKILANDGMEAEGIKLLEQAGFVVITENVPQAELADVLNENEYVALTVRSATKVNKALIDKCPGLKLVARGGVGMDNIDVEYAKSKNIQVVNTPAASSLSVAELVMAHIFSMARSLDYSNKNMPEKGQKEFAQLKKSCSKGIEVSGKTLGVIGFGRIGQAVGKLGISLGMHILAYDPYLSEATLELELPANQKVKIPVKTCSLNEVLQGSDFITLHVPGGEVITASEISKMKKGVMIVNASRGGVINENDLLEGLNSGQIGHAALDVFTGEPSPRKEILAHPKISLSPHIGGSTAEAQERIAVELAEKIIHFLK